MTLNWLEQTSLQSVYKYYWVTSLLMNVL